MQTPSGCMKIGILSDTHTKVGLTKHVIELFKKEEVGYIIHAGDIVKEENLKALKKSKIPYIAVLGNNDNDLLDLVKKYNLVSEPHYFKIDKLSVKLMHHPYYIKADADLIVYGHTHYFDAKVNKYSFFVNPGEVCARKKNLCECAIVKKDKSKWRIKRFTCKPDTLKWSVETKVFRV